jgi:predicted PurR-regulated permease PerM
MNQTLPVTSFRPGGNAPGSAVVTALVAALIVATLYFAREVLMPVALAVLMSFVLAPLVRLLQRCWVPRLAAVFVVVTLALAGLFLLGTLMVSQVNQLASDLPRYQFTLREKIQSLRQATAGDGALGRASEVLQDLSKELDQKDKAAVERGAPAIAGKPVPVEVRQPDPSALETLAALIAPLVHPLATTGIVVIFVIFILVQQQDLRNRLIRLAGPRDLQRTTEAMKDAGQRLSRLFLTQFLLNAGFGAVIGLGLSIIGVPSAPLWGMLAMVLRFVPYVGAIMAAVFPLVLAAAVSPGWSMVLWTAALFIVVEPIVGHVIEPLVYGHTAGLSPVAVVASATFWTWLWGPVGLVLATPLTICLVVLGRHVEQLHFLDVMLGDQPALTPAQLVYHRTLAGDAVEAIEQAETFLEKRPLADYYDEVLIGGLLLARHDATLGSLDHERMERIRDTVAEIVDDLADHSDEPEVPAEPDTNDGPSERPSKAELIADTGSSSLPKRWRAEGAVLCLGGDGPLDEAAAIALAQLIQRQGIDARSKEADALSTAKIFALDTKNTALVCLCYLDAPKAVQVRYAARRIRRKAPKAIILASLLGKHDEGNMPTNLEKSPDFEIVQGPLMMTVERVVARARESTGAGKVPLSLITDA